MSICPTCGGWSEDDDGNVPTIHQIQLLVCDHYGVSLIEMKSERRSENTVLARHMAQYIGREKTLNSLSAIARAFGRWEHTTVMHAVKHIEKLIRTDPMVRHDIGIIRRRLNEQRVHIVKLARDPDLIKPFEPVAAP